MHKTIEEGLQFLGNLAPQIPLSQVSISFAVPFTALFVLAKYTKEKKLPFSIGAQNLAEEKEGAFTGEVSAKMIQDAGAQFVLIGHSERRRLFHESDATVNKKLKLALDCGLLPHVCVGETLEERERGEQEAVISRQIEGSLHQITEDQVSKIVLAYEPVWAIGTGRVAKAEDAESMHAFCRRIISKKWGEKSAQAIRIQYGGSVQPDNARSLLEKPNIDGLLVGGASLRGEIFSQIINSQGSKI